MMTPEGKVKAAVDALLKEFGAYKHKPVQNGMGEPALDYHICHRGIYAGIETKAKGKLPTARQMNTIRRIVAAGGSVFFIDGDLTELRNWLAFPVASFLPQSLLNLLKASSETLTE